MPGTSDQCQHVSGDLTWTDGGIGEEGGDAFGPLLRQGQVGAEALGGSKLQLSPIVAADDQYRLHVRVLKSLSHSADSLDQVADVVSRAEASTLVMSAMARQT
jgi:hypothetical protein